MTRPRARPTSTPALGCATARPPQRTTGVIVAGVGGAVIVAAIVKLALVPNAPASSHTALRVLPGPDDAGLALSLGRQSPQRAGIACV
jgi:hypothetical protein